MFRKYFSLLVMLSYSTLSFCQAQRDNNVVTFKNLLTEMVDREALTRYPIPYYTFQQFSSYDRHTTEINDSTWFANMDCNYFMRVEEVDGREESVLMDTKGAGAIVRFWITDKRTICDWPVACDVS